MRWKLAVAALATSWGLIAVIVRKVDLDAQVLVFYRLAFAAVTLLLVAVALRRLALLRLTRHRGGVVLIGITLAAHWFLYFVTIKLSSVAVAVLDGLPRTDRDRAARSVRPARAQEPGRARRAAAGCGGRRAGCVQWGGGRSGSAARARHRAVHRRDVRRARADDQADRLRRARADASFWNYAIAAVAISPLLLDADRVVPTANELPAVLALGVVFTALSGYLYIWSLRHVTAQAIGILAYIEPVSAALMAWAFLDESLNWQIVVGGALVIAAGATVVFLEPEDAATPEVVPLGSRS